ncbi:MAG: glycosyltransferase [bacterium]
MTKELIKIRILYYGSCLSIQKGANLSMFRLTKSFGNGIIDSMAVLPGDAGIARKYHKCGIKYFVVPSMLMRNTFSVRYQIKYIKSLILEVVQLRQLIKRQRINIVHVNDITFFQALIAAKIAGVKSVCHIRFISIKNPAVRRILLLIVTFFSDVIICVSNSVKQQLFDNQERIQRSKIQVIYNPAPDAIDFYPTLNGATKKLKNELQLSPTAFIGCLISKFTHNKGQHILVKAAEILESLGYGSSHFQFLLVGGPLKNHMDYYNNILKMLEQNSLNNMIKLLGVRDDVTKILNLCDIAIHVPVHEDPFPGVVLEAMLAGKPVIGSNSGGIPEIIDDMENGFIIPKNDPNALAERLIALYKNRQVLNSMGEKASDSVRVKFPFSSFYEKHLRLYASLANLSLNMNNAEA